MFTGIIEGLGVIKEIQKEGTNIHFWVESNFTDQLKVDQSIAHNGVCLTVVDFNKNLYKVTIIDESLNRSNLGELNTGDLLNLERCTPLNARLDGHIVQGHVDGVGEVSSIIDQNGSYLITIETPENSQNLTVEKGSICVNGISLTVVKSEDNRFSVAIIPYTWQATNLRGLKIGDKVNLEYDIVGKYIRKLVNKSESN